MAGFSGGNAAEIEALNQRGGRMLSLLDLVEAGTASEQIASFLVTMARSNASFISGAALGGTGKSTLAGAILAHLGGGVRIKSVSQKAGIESADSARKVCFLAHEINSANYYGYICGAAARKFFSLPDRSRDVSICSTAHADTPQDMLRLLADGHNINDAARRLDYMVFIKKQGGERRISLVCQPAGSGFRVVYRHDPLRDRWDCEDEFDSGALGIGAAEFGEKLRYNREALRITAEIGLRTVGEISAFTEHWDEPEFIKNPEFFRKWLIKPSRDAKISGI